MSHYFEDGLLTHLPRLVAEARPPFFYYKETGIQQTIRRMQQAFKNSNVEHRQYFAVKALPNPEILRIMQESDCGFDCSSRPELILARKAGAVPTDIMFTSNNTSQEEFKEALAHDGCILNLDDISFIGRIPGGMPELVCFRLNPGRQKSEESNEIIGDPEKAKFGVPFEYIDKAFLKAKEAGAKRFGLHTMVCSNDLNYKHMVHTVKILLEVALKLQKELGIKLEFINMGGGIGIPYRPNEKEFDIEALARECAQLLQNFSIQSGYRPKLLTECGRYITGPHAVLVNEVINIMQKYELFVGVQAGMSALMRVGIYRNPDAYHHLTLVDRLGKPKEGPLTAKNVVGPNCENNDVLARNMLLPPCNIGDLAITHDAGAHCSAMTTNYNSRTRIQELLNYPDQSVRRICRAETITDLFDRHGPLGKEELTFSLA